MDVETTNGPKSAAQRMQEYRRRKRERQTEEERQLEAEKERERAAQNRALMNSTPEGAAMLAAQKKASQDKWRANMSRQKAAGQKLKSRNSMQKLRAERAEHSINISAGMHKIWEQRNLLTWTKSSKSSDKSSQAQAKHVQRRAKTLKRSIESIDSPEVRAQVVTAALSGLSPSTSKSLRTTGVIVDKGAVEVFFILNIILYACMLEDISYISRSSVLLRLFIIPITNGLILNCMKVLSTLAL